MFVEWSWVVALFLGATIGSFLNVVIYRLPRRISINNPRYSYCPNCNTRLGVPDLVPLLSWLFLRGKCRHCKNRISVRYFLVELLTGALWAGIWWQYLVAGWDPGKAIAYMLAAALLVVCIVVDLELYVIPMEMNIGLLVVGIGYNVWLYFSGSDKWLTWGLPSALAGALVGSICMWAVAFLGRVVFGKNAMGHGDILLARGIGSVLLPTAAVISFGLAVVCGAVFGTLQILWSLRSPGGEGEDAIEDPLEPVGQLTKAGLGYVLFVDVLGFFVPKVDKAWFGDYQEETIEDLQNFKVEATTIPFGPYLALGALVAMIFQDQVMGAIDAYWTWATGPKV